MPRTLLTAALFVLTPAFAIAQGPPPKHEKPTAKSDAGEAAKPYTVGSVVDPELTLTDLDGKRHLLKEYLGKTLVIDFWSIECPVSKGYEARLKQIYADYSKKGVVFLMVDANAGEFGGGDAPYAKIRKYIEDAKVPYPVLTDPGNVLADRFEAKTTPHVFIVDAKGKLRYAGGVDDDGGFEKAPNQVRSYVREALDALLEGKDPPQTKTTSTGCTIKRVRARG